jgi:hypothetical protein
MKLPFFNRQRYVLLTAYTPVEYLADHAPVCLSSKAIPEFNRTGKYDVGFKTCHGYIATLKRSATIMAPCDFDVTATSDTYSYRWPDQRYMAVNELNDPQFPSPNVHITQFNFPFALRCNKKDVNFLETRHILNDTHMMIPSGVAPFLYGISYNPFNYIPKTDTFYSVPFKKPLFALYPLTDLPFHVECHYDPVKYNQYAESGANHPKFKGSSIVLSKNKS